MPGWAKGQENVAAALGSHDLPQVPPLGNSDHTGNESSSYRHQGPMLIYWSTFFLAKKHWELLDPTLQPVLSQKDLPLVSVMDSLTA